jgi:hypothetical protein
VIHFVEQHPNRDSPIAFVPPINHDLLFLRVKPTVTASRRTATKSNPNAGIQRAAKMSLVEGSKELVQASVRTVPHDVLHGYREA